VIHGLWQIAFGTPGSVLPESTSGCATFGFATDSLWVNPETTATTRWADPVHGVNASGTFKSVAFELSRLTKRPALLLIWTTGTAGIETFLGEISSRFAGIPVVGGGAAWCGGETRGPVSPTADDVSVLAVMEGRWSVKVINPLPPRRTFRFHRVNARELKSLQLVNGGEYLAARLAFASLQSEFGKPSTDHESITFADNFGRNIHLHEQNGCLISGANLPDESETLTLRVGDASTVHGQLNELIAEPGTLLIGCAGLRGVLRSPVRPGSGSVAAFLYGEIMPFDGTPMFSNLMAAAVRREE
jgi:hypothetical protein